MEQYIPLTEGQNVALDELTAAVSPDFAELLAAQGPDVLNARVENLMQYRSALLGHIQTEVASAMPTRFDAMSDEEAKPRPLMVDVKH